MRSYFKQNPAWQDESVIGLNQLACWTRRRNSSPHSFSGPTNAREKWTKRGYDEPNRDMTTLGREQAVAKQVSGR